MDNVQKERPIGYHVAGTKTESDDVSQRHFQGR